MRRRFQICRFIWPLHYYQDLSGFHAPNALRTENWDSLEKALTVFILPEGASKTGTRKRLHRRLDLIFATPTSYWTAVVGW